MNFFDLVRSGYLEIEDDGMGNSKLHIDLDGGNGSNMQYFAMLDGVNASDVNWRHFITSHDFGDFTTSAEDDIIIVNGSTAFGSDGNDIIEVVGAIGGSIGGGEGDDNIIIDLASNLSQATYTIDGGDGNDTLVLDIGGSIDLGAITIGNYVNNFEALDLYGTDVHNITADNVFDLTTDNHVLYINDTTALSGGITNITLDVNDWENADHLLDYFPHVGNVAEIQSEYTTYAGEATNGATVQIHVHNSIDSSLV